MSGYFFMQRGWMDSPVFDDCNDHPFNERLAWIWLIEQACFEPHRTRYKSKMIEVNTGQVPTSYRRLQTAWGWGAGKVQRFLSLLESDGMIGTETERGFLIITICNYAKYQRKEDTSGTPMDTETERGRNAGGTNINKGITKGEINNPLIPILGKELTEKFEQHRKELRKKLTPTQREALAKKLSKMDNPAQAVSEAIANGWQGVFPLKNEPAKLNEKPRKQRAYT